MTCAPELWQVLHGVLGWGAALLAQHSVRRHGSLALCTSPFAPVLQENKHGFVFGLAP